MKIDITGQPPVDIFKDRPKHLWSSVILLSLAGCALLIMAYGILSDVQQSEMLENISLALLVGSAIVFTYSGAKLNAYKGLSDAQKNNLARLGRKYAEIDRYCKLVEQQGRQPIHAEYEACVEWDENITHQKEQAE